MDTLFQTKTAKKKIFWRGTYLNSLCRGLPPRDEKRVADYESRCLRKRDWQMKAEMKSKKRDQYHLLKTLTGCLFCYNPDYVALCFSRNFYISQEQSWCIIATMVRLSSLWLLPKTVCTNNQISDNAKKKKRMIDVRLAFLTEVKK